jgi:predicted GNAT family acetyltransferase
MGTAANQAAADRAGEVRDNPERQRFELALGAQGVAFINYRTRPAAADAPCVRVLTHAEVPPALRGAGVGARLTRGALELMRARGERAIALCPYVVDFILRHPEYTDVLAD